MNAVSIFDGYVKNFYGIIPIHDKGSDHIAKMVDYHM